jgi:hypothetical protein
MIRPFLLGFLLLATGGLQADDRSGPGRTTLQTFAWGTVFYDKASVGSFRWESTHGGLRFSSSQGEVRMDGSSASGLTLRWGKESLTLEERNGDVVIRTAQGDWSLKTNAGGLTIQGPGSRRITFERNIHAFTIVGPLGTVRGETQFGNLKLSGPGGTATLSNDNGVHRFNGPNPSTFPYLGRGLSFPFHGLGLFIELSHFFPIPEVADWVEWKPVVEPGF